MADTPQQIAQMRQQQRLAGAQQAKGSPLQSTANAMWRDMTQDEVNGLAYFKKATNQLYEEGAALFGPDVGDWPKDKQNAYMAQRKGLESTFIKPGAYKRLMLAAEMRDLADMERDGELSPDEAMASYAGAALNYDDHELTRYFDPESLDKGFDVMNRASPGVQPTQPPPAPVAPLVQRQAPPIVATTPRNPAPPQRSIVTTTPKPPRIPTQQEIAQERFAKRVQDFFAQPPGEPLPKRPAPVVAPAVALPDDPNPTGVR